MTPHALLRGFPGAPSLTVYVWACSWSWSGARPLRGMSAGSLRSSIWQVRVSLVRPSQQSRTFSLWSMASLKLMSSEADVAPSCVALLQGQCALYILVYTSLPKKTKQGPSLSRTVLLRAGVLSSGGPVHVPGSGRCVERVHVLGGAVGAHCAQGGPLGMVPHLAPPGHALDILACVW